MLPSSRRVDSLFRDSTERCGESLDAHLHTPIESWTYSVLLDEPQLVLLVHAISRGRYSSGPPSFPCPHAHRCVHRSRIIHTQWCISPLWAIFPAASDDRRFSTIVSADLILTMDRWRSRVRKGLAWLSLLSTHWTHIDTPAGVASSSLRIQVVQVSLACVLHRGAHPRRWMRCSKAAD